MNGNLEPRLRMAEKAARKAGEYLLSRPAFSVTHKAANDYVTESDAKCEELIREMLLAEFPGDGFLGEEEGESSGKSGRWIVDPIDGTTNYICDIPLYTISIAYESEGELALGCVYCPRLDEMYTAIKGRGAFRNGEPIHVSEKTCLRDALVGMSFAHRVEVDGNRMLRAIPALRNSVSDMRRLGSAALDLCFTACGRYEAFLELGLHIYDIAAGIVIVREAGGTVAGWPGDKGPVEQTGNVFACCESIYGQLRAVLVELEFSGDGPETDGTDAILVLGHRLKPDCTPTNDLVSRIDRTVALWKKTGAKVVMPCGGITRDRERSEAEVMREMLIERGVPDDVIRLENKSRTTTENIVNAKALMGTGARMALVTSDYHVERSLSLCRRLGLDAYGVAALTEEGEYRVREFEKDRMIYLLEEEARKEGVPEEEIMHWAFRRLRERMAAGEKIPGFPPPGEMPPFPMPGAPRP